MKWIWLQKLSVCEITPAMAMMTMTMMVMMMILFLCGRAAAAGKRLRHLGINLKPEFCRMTIMMMVMIMMVMVRKAMIEVVHEGKI